jgi:small subunit ribosomal protein S16
MLKIRLQRTGKRGQAYFRIVVVEHTKKTKGEYLELLGSYNPHEKQFTAKRERVEHWLSQGAQISPTVNNLMTNYKVWDRPKMQSWKPKVKKEGAASSAPAPKVVPVPSEQPAPVVA